jgi:V/A-type H+-transporting ATPase subunit I
MSIAKLKRVTLVGARADKPDMLEHLQQLGCMHLLRLGSPAGKGDEEAPPRARGARKALRFLSEYRPWRRQVLREADFDIDALVDEVLALKNALRDASDRRDFLVHRIAAIEPWGDIEFPPGDALAGYRLWFYVVPVGQRNALRSVDLPWQIVRSDHRYLYVVVIAAEEPDSTLLPVPRTHVGALPLGQLREQLADVEVELEELEGRRAALTRYLYLLRLNLADADNRASLAHASALTYEDDALVAVQGWVPVDAIDAVETLAAQCGLACLIADPAPADEPPTLIEQPAPMAAGVTLATFYQVPGYRSWDPSLLLFGSFSVFFSMILADAGYGLLLLAGLLAFWKRLGTHTAMRPWRLLGLSLCLCAIGYGVIVGSYFGITPSPGTLLGKLHVLHLDDFDTMMKLTIGIGAAHVALANAICAWVNRHRRTAVANLGWIGAIGGALALWLSGEGTAARQAAGAAAVASLVVVVLFASDRPIRRRRDHLLRFAGGLASLQKILNAFGDVLSYMRLFALGLASASLAITFNDLARDVQQASPGLGLLGSLLILGVGHTLNLALALMSGVVHGLRLNFIEFFNWGLPDEGSSFRRFTREEIEP